MHNAPAAFTIKSIKRNHTLLLRWDSFSERKYIPHNVQGSYLRVMVTRTGIEPMLPP